MRAQGWMRPLDGWLRTAACGLALCALLAVRAQMPSGRSCFCKLSENVDECACTVDSVDTFNNDNVFPLLHELLQRNFFRYYKVNMDRPCPFWSSEAQCGSDACGIESCDDEVPAALKRSQCGAPQLSDEPDEGERPAGVDSDGNRFDPIDRRLSAETQRKLDEWDDHDDAENNFCDVDDDSSDSHYVDLNKNPERYTGYKGNSAQRVWKAIYMENCFKPHPKFDTNFLLHPSITASTMLPEQEAASLRQQFSLTEGSDLRGLCLEKRVFYRVISGLHTSITVSIASHNYVPAAGGLGSGRWERNVDMFKWRFAAETTQGEGPQRLKNLYLVYLMQLRALHKIAPYLRSELFYTGDEQEDEHTRQLIDRLLNAIKQFPDHFDESAMFQGVPAHGRQLKEEFRLHFHNVSRIMDCVDCDKCRLWGKLQTHGLGTAFKILFSNGASSDGQGQLRRVDAAEVRPAGALPFRLNRNDLVALLHSFGRFAANIREVGEFRRLLDL